MEIEIGLIILFMVNDVDFFVFYCLNLVIVVCKVGYCVVVVCLLGFVV